MKKSLMLAALVAAGAFATGAVAHHSVQNVFDVNKTIAKQGILKDIDWQNPRRVPVAFRQDLVIVHETPPYPRALEMVRPGMDPKVEARLREVLIEAAGDPDAREAMLRMRDHATFRSVFEAALAARPEFIHHSREECPEATRL